MKPMRRSERSDAHVTRRVLLAILAAVALVAADLPGTDTRAAERPPVAGRNGGISAGHPLTAAAGFEVLTRGGNAFDAGVASLLVGGVVEQDFYSLGGEGLVLVYPRSTGKVVAVVGQGWAPKGATIDWYNARNKDLNGEGLDPAVVPGALHAALTVLEQWGTMSFEQVSARAIEYAEQGFPMRPRTANAIEKNLTFFKGWPDNQAYWLKPDGSMYRPGETIKLPTLARTLRKMVEAERAAKAKGRAAGIAAARDRFYKGDIARDMVAFLQKHEAPFDLSDFAAVKQQVGDLLELLGSRQAQFRRAPASSGERQSVIGFIDRLHEGAAGDFGAGAGGFEQGDAAAQRSAQAARKIDVAGDAREEIIFGDGVGADEAEWISVRAWAERRRVVDERQRAGQARQES